MAAGRMHVNLRCPPMPGPEGALATSMLGDNLNFTWKHCARMEKIAELLFSKALPSICATATDVRTLFQSNKSFLNLMKARPDICPRAWLFGLLTAALLGVLGLPSLRLAGVKPSLELAGVMTTINWFLIAIYGACFGVAASVLRSRRHVMVSVNTLFYLSIWLVVLKLFESPALGARFLGMVQSCSSMDYSSAVTAAIQKSQTTSISDKLVGVGYLLFGIQLVRVHKGLHDFGWMRATAATIIGMMLLSAVVSYVQEPVIAQMICSYASPS